MTDADGEYTVLLTHSSRPVDYSECTYQALVDRYSDPNRLNDLPPFESLPHIDTRRHFRGGLSILNLKIEGGRPRLRRLNYLDPDFKIQHAALVDRGLVLCLEDALLLLDDPTARFTEAHTARINDPWFAGLHTVFTSGNGRCIVSASAPDAVLEVDLDKKAVVRRMRLPSSIYGKNYALDERCSLAEHYIYNDIQLAHLNCAWPTSGSAIYVSSLIYGDIGRFDADGRYELLSRGHIGCHAARTTMDHSTLYFADSCHGVLVLCDLSGSIRRKVQVDSKWLHDAQHVGGNVYALCLSDRNLLLFLDIESGEPLLTESFAELGGSLQFINVQRRSH